MYTTLSPFGNYKYTIDGQQDCTFICPELPRKISSKWPVNSAQHGSLQGAVGCVGGTHVAVGDVAGKRAIVQEGYPQAPPQVLGRPLVQLRPYLHVDWRVPLLLRVRRDLKARIENCSAM